MTDNEKWSAVRENNSSYDGSFFYAVKTTRIFCRPSCMSKTPLRENTSYFETADDALRSGYRPCKRCRPDLLRYQPVKELAEKMKALIDSSMEQKWLLDKNAASLGVTPGRMAEIFREQYGMTISEYIKCVRLKKATALLVATDDPVLEIALTAGFASVSSFYRLFRKHTGLSPAAYRKKHAGKEPPS